MALAARVMGGGIPAGMAKALSGGVAASVSAAGTTQGTATALVASINYVSTVAASSGVIMPLCEDGDSVDVYNAGANTLTIYPPSGAKINQVATNSGVSLGINTAMRLTRISKTQWIASLSA